MNRSELPLALRIVAWLFLFQGIYAVLDILVCASHFQLQLDFDVIGIFVWAGLLRLSNGWRICALVLIGIGIFFLGIVATLAFAAPEGHIEIFHQKIMSIPPPLGALWAIIWLGLAIWQYRVLKRPDVVGLFE